MKKICTLTIIFVILLFAVTGCGVYYNSSNENIRPGKYEEWSEELGLRGYDGLHVDCYYKEYADADNILTVDVFTTDNYEESFVLYNNLIEKHNSFVRSNPDYFEDNLIIRMNYARYSGAIDPYYVFMNRPIESTAIPEALGQSVDNTLQYVQIRIDKVRYDNTLNSISTSIEVPTVILDFDEHGNNSTIEQNYSGLSRFSNHSSVIINSNKELDYDTATQYIQTIDANASVYKSIHMRDVEKIR